jgi:uncharacterized protein YjiS (DUF1127 family)
MTILTLRRLIDAGHVSSGGGEVSAVAHIGNCLHTIVLWLARTHTRRALRELAESHDIHLLKDIGVSRADAVREAEKPFWRP